ncbi:hypothetical protein J6590_107283, partial [Homalodisca vitripennis]
VGSFLRENGYEVNCLPEAECQYGNKPPDYVVRGQNDNNPSRRLLETRGWLTPYNQAPSLVAQCLVSQLRTHSAPGSDHGWGTAFSHVRSNKKHGGVEIVTATK